MCEKVVKIWKATKLKVLDKGVCITQQSSDNEPVMFARFGRVLGLWICAALARELTNLAASELWKRTGRFHFKYLYTHRCTWAYSDMTLSTGPSYADCFK